jgi:hypothetical protein
MYGDPAQPCLGGGFDGGKGTIYYQLYGSYHILKNDIIYLTMISCWAAKGIA